MSHEHTHSISGPIYTSHIHSISDPSYVYGRVNLSQVTQDHMEQMRRRIEQGIFEERILLNQLTKQAQEKPMSTLDKIKAERREKREREELEAKFEAWETRLGIPSLGDIVSWTWTPGEKKYIYAAVWADDKWYTTDTNHCPMTAENFVGYLIEKNIDVNDLTYMDAVD